MLDPNASIEDGPSFFDKWSSAVFQYRKILLALLLLLTSLLTILVTHKVQKEGIPLDFTPQSIFMDNGEMVRSLHQIEQDFAREDNDFLILLQSNESLLPYKDSIAELHHDLSQIAGVTQTLSLVNAQSISPGAMGIELQDIWLSDNPWKVADENPIFHHLLGDASGHLMVIQVRAQPDLEKVADLEPIYQNIQKTILAAELPQKIQTQITGVPLIRMEIVNLMWEDELFYIPVTAVIFTFTIFLLFKGFKMALAPVVSVLLSMGWAVGLLILMGVTFNILSMLIPAIALVIGIADGIHVIERYREELFKDHSPAEALSITLKEMWWACFLTSFTTGMGFASLLVADTLVIRDFGIHSAITVGLTFVGIMCIIPIWLAFLPKSAIPKPLEHSSSFYRKLHHFTIEHPKSILLFSFLFFGMSAMVARNVQANSYILEMYHPEHPTPKNLQTVEEKLGGVVPMFIHFEHPDLMDPLILAKIQSIEEEIRQESFVRWTTSFPRQLQQIHLAFSSENTLPDSKDLIAQELLLAQMAGDLPLSNIINAEQSQTRILIQCQDVGGVAFLQFKKRLEDLTASTFEQDPTMKITINGDGLLASVGIDKLIGDLLASVGLIFAIIALVFWAMLKDIGLSIIAFIPNALPLLVALATLHLFGADLQVSNIVSFTVAIGLAVDDTIHFMARYKAERGKGLHHFQAMEHTFQGAGHAIVLTSILLVSGFGLLSTSELSSTFYFGVLTSITLATALIADLLLLPALMHLYQNLNGTSDNRETPHFQHNPNH